MLFFVPRFPSAELDTMETPALPLLCAAGPQIDVGLQSPQAAPKG